LHSLAIRPLIPSLCEVDPRVFGQRELKRFPRPFIRAIQHTEVAGAVVGEPFVQITRNLLRHDFHSFKPNRLASDADERLDGEGGELQHDPHEAAPSSN
jgi:hypothetical protein